MRERKVLEFFLHERKCEDKYDSITQARMNLVPARCATPFSQCVIWVDDDDDDGRTSSPISMPSVKPKAHTEQAKPII